MTSNIKECAAYAVRARGNAQDMRLLNEEDVLTMATLIMESRFVRSHYLTSPEHTKQYLTLTLANEPREVFALVLLDSQHGVLGMEKLFYGTIDGATIYPREIVKCVLKANAAAVILVHNHPSGNDQPSQDDRQITRRIVEALKTVDVRILDHLLVAGTSVVSFAELGLLP